MHVSQLPHCWIMAGIGASQLLFLNWSAHMEISWTMSIQKQVKNKPRETKRTELTHGIFCYPVLDVPLHSQNELDGEVEEY
jgi:hypothetical protein